VENNDCDYDRVGPHGTDDSQCENTSTYKSDNEFVQHIGSLTIHWHGLNDKNQQVHLNRARFSIEDNCNS
jgi:hypothetical protein